MGVGAPAILALLWWRLTALPAVAAVAAVAVIARGPLHIAPSFRHTLPSFAAMNWEDLFPHIHFTVTPPLHKDSSLRKYQGAQG